MKELQGLREVFGNDLIADNGRKLSRYAIDQVGDQSYARRPDAVVFPTHRDQVVALMQWANRNGIPVTPRGGGSGLAGAAIPAPGGVVCSFEKMNGIIEVDTGNLMVVVEPGVVTSHLDEVLKPHGLFFAGYPMSEDICCIGGNVAENAGGGRAIRYGTTAHYVLGAEVVTPTGRLLRLGGKRLKDVTGYNLLQLMIGSEGTLGLFTQLTIRVVPRPGARGVLFAAFPDSARASAAVTVLRRLTALSSLEFIDGQTARLTNAGLPRAQQTALPPRADAFLLVELEAASEADVAREMSAAAALIGESEGAVVDSGSDEEPMQRVWRLRKAVPWWTKRVAGSYHSLEDVVVPPARIPALVEFADQLRTRYATPIAVFGHAGDGNFHITPMKPEAMAPGQWSGTIDRLLRDLYGHVADLGGTISGEHGIGRKRTRYLSLVLSAEEIAVLQTVKRALDPNNVLNPGVVLPVV
ncbi:MAG: FAD-binding oxidoreductase [Spirochaetaceae bacterium]|nr:MAG: FAD-binding oxidoreductase [Spirochaetaceae bacterium]